MNENKKEFVEALSDALKMDGRSGVDSIVYATDIWFEDILYEEVVRVNFKSGAYKLINVTANSNMSNSQEIISAVYGRKPVGLIFSGFDDIEPSDNCPQDDIEPWVNCPFCGPEEKECD